jgi:V/A-type H+-transporting ATPase subunit A
MGSITLLNGPIAHVEGFKHAKIGNICFLGEYQLPGEVIKLQYDDAGEISKAIVQVFENTSGTMLGDDAVCLNRPLSMELGPGLLGNIFDGIQRPLNKYYELSAGFIKRGLKLTALDRKKLWKFKPVVQKGDIITGGDIIGEVQETTSIAHRILVPPGVNGKVVEIAKAGTFTIDETVCKLASVGGTSGPKRTVELQMYHEWPISIPRPYVDRLLPTTPLISGVRLIDTLFPITKGGCAAIPGGFGTGKTVMQQQFAKYCDAQIIVYIGCGERGNELADILESFPKLSDAKGFGLMDRTVIIGNTSNMPVSAREASIFSGMTIAEYFRDQGYPVAVMADSTSRWAEALREISGRLEELPAESGYPAYLGSKLAAFYERAGYVELIGSTKRYSSVSIIGAVSPPGGDFSDPVVQTTKRFIKSFWALDPKLAYARQYPAINWIDSYSLYYDDVKKWWMKNVDPEWGKNHDLLTRILHEDYELQDIVKLLGADALPLQKQLVIFTADLVKKSFLGQNAFDPIDAKSGVEKQAKMLGMYCTYYTRSLELLNHGAPLFKLQDLKSVEKMLRVGTEIKDEDAAKIDDIVAEMDKELDSMQKVIS